MAPFVNEHIPTSDETSVLRKVNRTGATVDTKLAKDVHQVAFYGGLGDEEETGDLFVSGAGSKEPEHLNFAVSKLRERATHALITRAVNSGASTVSPAAAR